MAHQMYWDLNPVYGKKSAAESDLLQLHDEPEHGPHLGTSVASYGNAPTSRAKESQHQSGFDTEQL
jgi:hypothetical protein